MTTPQDDIRARMELYFDGLHHADTGRLAQVFHPSARYICATGGKLTDLGLDAYFPIVDAREPPAARGEARRDEIVSIRLAGADTALVEARCAIGERYFTDFLSFVRTADGWQIIAKVFHHEPLPPDPVGGAPQPCPM